MSIKPGYTRISEILSHLNTYADINPQVLNRKAKIGTEVHESINAFLNDIHLPVSDQAEGYFQSWKFWNELASPTFCFSEERFYDDSLMITGCVDGIITFPYSKSMHVIDYKTSASENQITWPLQATFYHYLASKAGLSVSEKIMFVKLDKSGKSPKIFEYTYTPNLFKKCMEALESFRNSQKDLS